MIDIITEGVTRLLFESGKMGLQFLSKVILEGMLKDVAGQPLGGCQVILRRDRPLSCSDISAASGRFIIKGVAPGQYDIEISSPHRDRHYSRFDKVLLQAGVHK